MHCRLRNALPLAACRFLLFTADGDVVNVLGWWWRGRPDIERKLTAAFPFVFKESRLANDP